MDLGSVNWLAVIVCVVVAMISGFIWYHPKVFFPAWWEGIGKSGEPGNPNPMIYVFPFSPRRCKPYLYHSWSIPWGVRPLRQAR